MYNVYNNYIHIFIYECMIRLLYNVTLFVSIDIIIYNNNNDVVLHRYRRQGRGKCLIFVGYNKRVFSIFFITLFFILFFC